MIHRSDLEDRKPELKCSKKQGKNMHGKIDAMLFEKTLEKKKK